MYPPAKAGSFDEQKPMGGGGSGTRERGRSSRGAWGRTRRACQDALTGRVIAGCGERRSKAVRSSAEPTRARGCSLLALLALPTNTYIKRHVGTLATRGL